MTQRAKDWLAYKFAGARVRITALATVLGDNWRVKKLPVCCVLRSKQKQDSENEILEYLHDIRISSVRPPVITGRKRRSAVDVDEIICRGDELG